jgi:hypothetical protein
VADDERQENGSEDRNRFLDPPQVEHDEHHDDEGDGRELVCLPPQRQEAEYRIDPCRYRDGHGQDVVNDQRRAGDDPRLLPEQLGGEDVPSPPHGKLLDDPRIAPRNDEYRNDRGDRDEDRQGGMLSEGKERLLGAVGGGGNPVGTEADPREKSDQRDPMEEFRVEQVTGRPKEEPLGALEKGCYSHKGWCYPPAIGKVP